MTSDVHTSVTRGFAWKTALDAVTSIVLIASAVTLVWFNVLNRRTPSRDPKVPSDPISIENAALKGSPSATAVMIVFSDFQCPFCASFAREIMPQLERDYVAQGRLQLAYRYLPLAKHQHALGAAHAAECASRQGEFWPMHDRLFNAGAQLDDSGLRAIAASLNLDDAAYAVCLNERVGDAAVSRDIQQASTLGLTSTPAFLLGSRLRDGRVHVSRAFYGARPIEEFRSELDRVIKPSEPGWFRKYIRAF